MRLAHKYGYRLEGNSLHIASFGSVPIVRRPRHEPRYADWEAEDAVLVIREDGAFLHVPKARVVPRSRQGTSLAST